MLEDCITLNPSTLVRAAQTWSWRSSTLPVLQISALFSADSGVSLFWLTPDPGNQKQYVQGELEQLGLERSAISPFRTVRSHDLLDCLEWNTDRANLWRRTGHIALRAGGIPGGGERPWHVGKERSAVGPHLFLCPSHAPVPDPCLLQLLAPAPFPCHGESCRPPWGTCSCTGWRADEGCPGLWSPLLFLWPWD